MTAIAVGIRSQSNIDDLLDFSSTIALGGAAQLLLPQQPGRTSLFIQNSGPTDTLHVTIGPPRAVATLAAGGVSAIALDNSGIGYSVAPRVQILGGLYAGDYRNAPSNSASAHAVMAGSPPLQTISAIIVDSPGSGYLVPPLIYLVNDWPTLGGGAAIPTATRGMALAPGAFLNTAGMFTIPGSAVAIFGPTTADSFTCYVGGLV